MPKTPSTDPHFFAVHYGSSMYPAVLGTCKSIHDEAEEIRYHPPQLTLQQTVPLLLDDRRISL